MNGLKVILLTSILVACGVNPSKQAQNLPNQLDLPYHRFTLSLKPVDESFIDSGLSLIFPLVTGSIFASPSEEILHISPAHNGRFVLDLPQDIDGFAREINEQGLLVEPAETRILRMGTFHVYPYYQALGDGGFINGENGNALLLVYFSQAASISGRLAQFGEVFIHDLNIKQTGWHWLEIAKKSEHTYEVTNFKQGLQHIYFAVLLDDMAAKRQSF
jgi:hypothetical protein